MDPTLKRLLTAIGIDAVRAAFLATEDPDGQRRGPYGISWVDADGRAGGFIGLTPIDLDRVMEEYGEEHGRCEQEPDPLLLLMPPIRRDEPND